MKIAALLIFAAALALQTNPLRAEVTKKQFRQDLSFYRKTAKEKNLNPNDRLFILNRLRDKYTAAPFDVTELYGEIDKWSARRIREWKRGESEQSAQTQQSQPPAATEAPPAAPSGASAPIPSTEVFPRAAPDKSAGVPARLTKILISESAGQSRLTLNVPGLEEYKEVPVNPDGSDRPQAAVLYLYHTKNVLPAKFHTLKPKKGFIREVQVKRVTSKPPTVKVSVAFRKNYPYDIERTGDQLTVNVYNAAPQVQTQAPTPQDALDAAPEAEPQPEAAGAPRSGPLTPEPFTLHGASQTIEPGQIVSVDFVKYPEFNRTTVVAPDGQAHVAPAGLTAAAGLTADEFGGSVVKKIEDVFLKTSVKASAKDFDFKTRVALIGSVKNEGSYEFSQGMGCYELISRSGGFAPGADKKDVRIHRMTKQSRKKLSFDVDAFAASAEPVNDFHLEAGDVVEVRKTPAVFVFGEVRAPDFLKIKEPISLSKALSGAGGLNDRADLAKVILIREEEGQNIKRTFSMNEIRNDVNLDPVIREGDMIYAQPLKGKSKFFNKETISWGAFFMSLGLVLALLV